MFALPDRFIALTTEKSSSVAVRRMLETVDEIGKVRASNDASWASRKCRFSQCFENKLYERGLFEHRITEMNRISIVRTRHQEKAEREWRIPVRHISNIEYITQ